MKSRTKAKLNSTEIVGKDLQEYQIGITLEEAIKENTESKGITGGNNQNSTSWVVWAYKKDNI